jgi:hypothetical protein
LFFLDDLSGWQRYKTVFHETGLAPLSCLFFPEGGALSSRSNCTTSTSTTTPRKTKAYMSGTSRLTWVNEKISSQPVPIQSFPEKQERLFRGQKGQPRST